MWVAKIRLLDKEGIFGIRTKKFNILIYGYIISYYQRAGYACFAGIGVVEGKEKNKKAFFKDLRRDKHITRLEVKGDIFSYLARRSKKKSLERFEQVFFNPVIFHLKPILIQNNGWEEWEMGSWEKKSLVSLVNLAIKQYYGEDLIMKDMKLGNIQTFSLSPGLTAKQKTALRLAIKCGYYESPRKIKLEELAEMQKISFSTYKAHLRKAEKKIIPFVSKRL